jgi:hypothetical protein
MRAGGSRDPVNQRLRAEVPLMIMYYVFGSVVCQYIWHL